MRGIDEAKALYFNRGKEIIHKRLPEFEGRIAVGMAGHGSECFGFDDETSRDHDFEPGFCIWLTDDDDILFGPRLSGVYREIVGEGKAIKSAFSEKKLGVRRISDFYRRYTGSEGAPESWRQWLSIPSFSLAEATNGEVWYDELGAFSAIREKLKSGMPEDVRKKKLAARAVSMAQSGQYNYARCISHGEPGAARLAADEFVRECSEMIYLLNRAYAPYYKWIFRGMKKLRVLSELREPLEFVLAGSDDSGLISDVIDNICFSVIRELKAQGLTDGPWDYLEPHAFEIQERIENREIRSLHIMEG